MLYYTILIEPVPTPGAAPILHAVKLRDRGGATAAITIHKYYSLYLSLSLSTHIHIYIYIYM